MTGSILCEITSMTYEYMHCVYMQVSE